ncbi:MAG TPA: efflux RND transporter permease subunit [Anaerohalosphaeraceae bacterium]|nr:efflux RND transporter permease subunit [Anaerohalosphaeraceae bacterium]
MNVAELAIQKKTISWVFTVLILLGGLFAYLKMGRLEDPEFTIKAATVITYYPGATAMEVAEEVTDEIETAIQKLGQVDYVKSLSMPGFSYIHVELKKETPKDTIPQVWDELRRKVGDMQSKLPPGTSTSVVNDDYGDVYGVFYAVYGDGYSYAELKEHADMLRRELLLVQDVANVTLFGVQQEVVYVEISRARLAQLGISIQTLIGTLTGQNMAVDAGSIQVGSQYIRIQPTGELKSVQEIGNILIAGGSGGSKLYLRDIATISRGYQEPPTAMMSFNGKPAIGVGISTVEGGNVVVMGNAVEKRLKELQSQTPIGIEIGTIVQQAQSVTAAISGFVINLIEAVIIVIGVLIFAMGFRSGIIIGAILLLTVCASFIIMQSKGVMLERISLGALIIALGMLVDNAIVIVEGILVNGQMGMDKTKAAAAIVKQTMWPLFGATVVAILAFAAIGASNDSTGEYCRSLYQVIMYSMMWSWVLAITLCPLFGVQFLKTEKQQGGNADPYKGSFFQAYKKFLVFCIRNRYFTLILLAAMLIFAIYGFGFVDKSFFPDSTQPQFMVHYWLPQGTYITQTEKDLKQIADHVKTLEGVSSTASCAGQGFLRFQLTYTPEEPNPAYGMILVTVEDYKAIPDLMTRINEYIAQTYPQSQGYCRRFVLGPGDPFKIQARLRGPDPVVLRQLSLKVEQIMRDNPNTADINTDWRQPVPLIRPVVADTQARNAGIARADIAQALLYATEGRTVGYYREQDELLPIVARSPQAERNNPADLANIEIFSPAAQRFIPLQQVVVDFKTVSENQIIRRRDRLPTLIVRCDPKDGPASIVFNQLRPQIEAVSLPSGYTLEWGGEYENSGDAQKALAANIPVITVLVVLIVIMLFDSIKKPLIIFLTVPLAVIGVTAGLLLMKQPFGFMALLGFMSLAGMLIKNSVVLIDEINAQLASGKDPYLAVVDSGVSRVRPVSMAALTTVMGMAPLLVDAFFVSMAVTIMFGLTFATILTLVVVPVLFAVMFNIREKS